MRGLIIKGIGGFYYVKTADGVFRAKGRGLLKKDGFSLAVGDYVDLEIREDGDSVINSIEERRNAFIRPPIVNVDRFIIVAAAAKPKPNFEIIDRFLIMAEKNHTDAVICINKADLAKKEFLENIEKIYGEVYPVVFVSAKTGDGIAELKKHISGGSIAFAGPSGVGKSTLINLLVPEANMETGHVSTKTSRGKHTTRHVEIFESGEGRIFDTPGFTSFDILDVEESELGSFYPEIEKYAGGCRFDDCRHLKEPDCSVRDAVEEGKISQERYKSYISNIEEIRKRKKY